MSTLTELENLFGNDAAQIASLKEKYPYFSLAHLYDFLKNSEGTDEFALKAGIHFTNHEWLHRQKIAAIAPSVFIDEIHFPKQEENQIHEVENPLPTIEPVSVNEPKVEETDFAKAELENNVEEKISENEIVPQEQIHEVENPLPTIEPVTVNEPKVEETDSPAPELEKTESKAEDNNEELLFEPLHTTDYFASQGIKLNDQMNPNDRLGKQLKSFTQWLKTMKKPGEIGITKTDLPNVQIDENVQKLAENSNLQPEVITENMAEAFSLQGKLKQAIEIYEKLSLQNPAKSSYFAAKIENLKES